jgi:hypothetical protein
MRTLTLSLALLAACTVKNPGYIPAEGGPPSDLTSDQPASDSDLGPRTDARPESQLPPQKPKGVDVLIVVDDSPGMSYGQAWLARDIEALTAALDALPGGPSYRVGVVSTDLGVGTFANSNCSASGDAGKLLLRPVCPVPSGGVKYVQRVGSALNVSGTVKDAIGCMVQLGQDGCGFEQPLEAMRVALTANTSFLRPDAALAVIFLTNEDDCSAKSAALYDPGDTALGPYSSYRCFQYGVLCSGQKPPLEPTVLQACKPGGTWLWEVKPRYVDFLRGLKPQGWLSVLVLAAQPLKLTEVAQNTYRGNTYYLVKPACTSTSLTGDPAFRLQELVDQLATQGLFSSICAVSYVPALKGLATRIQAAF